MNGWNRIAALAATTAALAASGAAKEVVAFQITLSEGGKMIHRSTIYGDYDKTASVEMAGKLKYDALAKKPGKDGLSEMSVKIYMLDEAEGKVKFLKELTARTDLAKRTPIEYSVPGKPLKFTVTPGLDKLPE
ncbi:MAG TPA: hypothetical protein VFP44_20070 [Usitatibacter sp.]|nr:hypothetical protein [Usitatibacter sp.]